MSSTAETLSHLITAVIALKTGSAAEISDAAIVQARAAHDELLAYEATQGVRDAAQEDRLQAIETALAAQPPAVDSARLAGVEARVKVIEDGVAAFDAAAPEPQPAPVVEPAPEPVAEAAPEPEPVVEPAPEPEPAAAAAPAAEG